MATQFSTMQPGVSPVTWKNGAGAGARSASLRSDDDTSCQAARKQARGMPNGQQQARAGGGGEEEEEDEEESEELGSGGTVAGQGGDGGEVEQAGGQGEEEAPELELTVIIHDGLTALTDRREGLMQKISELKDTGLQHIEELKQGFVQSMERLAQDVDSVCDSTQSQWTDLSKQTRQSEERLRVARDLMDQLGHGRQ